MWELDNKETWAPKNWCFWTVVLEKMLEKPLDCKEIQSVHSKGDQSWIFIGRTYLKLKFQYFGHLMWRINSLEKTLMLGMIEGRRRRGPQRMRWLDGITDLMDIDTTEWLNWHCTKCFGQKGGRSEACGLTTPSNLISKLVKRNCKRDS